MLQPKPINPFYSVLVVVGIVFAITACAYGVMTVRGLDPRNAEEAGLMGFLDDHGIWVLVGELVILGVLTVAAIASDDFWTRRSGSTQVPESDVTGRPVG